MSKVLVEQIEKSFSRADGKGVDLAGGSNVQPLECMVDIDDEGVDWKLAMRTTGKRDIGTVFVTYEVLGGAGWVAASEIKIK